MSEIIEYVAVGREVVACYDDGREQVVLVAEDEGHAEEKAQGLNSKLIERQGG